MFWIAERKYWFKRHSFWVAVCAAGVAFNLSIAIHSEHMWHVDFNQFYAAGKLVGTGRLYDWEALSSLQKQNSDKPTPVHRIPAYAFTFKPLAQLPYTVAVRLWFAVSIGSLAAFVFLCPFGSRRTAGVVCCWSHPIAIALGFGQDNTLLLLYYALAIWLLAVRRDGSAGLALSLGIAKPHIAVTVPILLLAQRRWRAFTAATIGVAVALLASFLLEGINWPVRLLEMLRLPISDMAPERMITLRGLVSTVPSFSLVELVLAAFVLVLTWRVCDSRRDLVAGGALSLAAGVIVSRHGYLQDASLLIPLIVVLIDRPGPFWLKFWAVLGASPIPSFLLLSSWPFLGQVIIVGLPMAALVWCAFADQSEFSATLNHSRLVSGSAAYRMDQKG